MRAQIGIYTYDTFIQLDTGIIATYNWCVNVVHKWLLQQNLANSLHHIHMERISYMHSH